MIGTETSSGRRPLGKRCGQSRGRQPYAANYSFYLFYISANCRVHTRGLTPQYLTIRPAISLRQSILTRDAQPRSARQKAHRGCSARQKAHETTGLRTGELLSNVCRLSVGSFRLISVVSILPTNVTCSSALMNRLSLPCQQSQLRGLTCFEARASCAQSRLKNLPTRKCRPMCTGISIPTQANVASAVGCDPRAI